jgi:hypothetical protein
VTLEDSPADLSLPTEKYFSRTSLYDGQTRELLATTTAKGLDRSKWSGSVYGKPIAGYDDTNAYILDHMNRDE